MRSVFYENIFRGTNIAYITLLNAILVGLILVNFWGISRTAEIFEIGFVLLASFLILGVKAALSVGG